MTSTEHLISPERTITIGEKSYTLDGSFATLRNVAHAFGKDIIYLIGDILTMRVDQVALMVALGIGKRDDADLIGQEIIDVMDIVSPSSASEYMTLKLELLAWIQIIVSPKSDRLKKSQGFAALLSKQKSARASLGKNIKGSVLDSSSGVQRTSGKVTSGSSAKRVKAMQPAKA